MAVIPRSGGARMHAGVEIEIDHKDVDYMNARLERQLSGQGLEEFLRGRVEPYMRDRAAKRFMSEGDDVTGGWLPLHANTVDIRINEGYGGSHPINRRTGDLYGYVTRGLNDIKRGEDSAQMTMPGRRGTRANQEKLRTAQIGKDRPRTPPRPVLAMNEIDMIHVLEMLAVWVQTHSVMP